MGIRKSRKNHDSRIMRTLMITLLFVFLTPLIINTVYNAYLIIVMRDENVARYNTEFAHSATMFDSMISGFFSIGNQLRVNNHVNEFKRQENVITHENVYEAIRLRRELPWLFQVNQFAFNYFLFFNNSELVINNTMVYSFEDFYYLHLREARFHNYQEWHNEFTNRRQYGVKPVRDYVLQNSTVTPMMSIVIPMLATSTADGGVISIFIEESQIQSFFPTIDEHSIQVITNLNGDILYVGTLLSDVSVTEIQAITQNWTPGEGRSTARIQGSRYLHYSYSVSANGLIFHLFQSQAYVNERLMDTIIWSAVVLLLAVLVGGFLSYRLSHKLSTPINDILKSYYNDNLPQNHKEAFRYLQHGFSDLLAKNKRLGIALENQKAHIMSAFISRLIYSNYIDEKEVEGLAEYLGINTKEQLFWIVLIKFDFQGEALDKAEFVDSSTLSLSEAIGKSLSNTFYANLGNEQMVLLFGIEIEKKEEYQSITEQSIYSLRTQIPQEVSEKMHIIGGNVVNSLMHLNVSYNNANYAYAHYFNKQRDIIWYEEGGRRIEDYPAAELFTKIIYYVTLGDEKKCNDALRFILEEYIIRRNMPVYLQNMLLNEMQASLFRILPHLDLEDDRYHRFYQMLEKNMNESLLEQVRSTISLYKEICSYVNQRKYKNEEELIRSVIVHIEKNYQNNDLSLASVADAFRIHESRLSSLFKAEMKIVFSDYVEKIRLDYAKELLTTTRLAIKTISAEVGYYSFNSFCRSFKRVEGMSASEYRKRYTNH